MNKGINLKELKACFGLTPRETDVLKRLLRGMTNADIAGSLHITEQTVKDHLSKVYKKTGAKNRFELVRYLVGKSSEKGAEASGKVSDPASSEDALLDMSFTDELTGLYNRKGFLALMKQHIELAKRQKKNVYMVRAEVHNHGATLRGPRCDERDFALWEAANILKETFRESDVIARIGGYEFAVIPFGTPPANADRIVDRLEKNIESFNSTNSRQHALAMSCSVAYCFPKSSSSAGDPVLRSDGTRYRQVRSKK